MNFKKHYFISDPRLVFKLKQFPINKVKKKIVKLFHLIAVYFMKVRYFRQKMFS